MYVFDTEYKLTQRHITYSHTCVLLHNRHNPGTDTIHMYYLFRPIVTIIRYTVPTQASVYTLGVRCICMLFM
jgi:hypothetical protein